LKLPRSTIGFIVGSTLPPNDRHGDNWTAVDSRRYLWYENMDCVYGGLVQQGTNRNEEEPFPFCRCDDSNILLAFVYKLSIDKFFSYLSKLI
jgi:hypothetical protein